MYDISLSDLTTHCGKPCMINCCLHKHKARERTLHSMTTHADLMQAKACHIIGVVDNTYRKHVHAYFQSLKNAALILKLIYIYGTT